MTKRDSSEERDCSSRPSAMWKVSKKTNFVNRWQFIHTGADLLMLSSSLRTILTNEVGIFLNHSVAEDLVERVSYKCAVKNLFSIAKIMSQGRMHRDRDEHIQVMRLVSCAMENHILYSNAALQALIRIAFIAVLHEIEESSETYSSREYRRYVHYLVDVFQDKRIKSQELQELRDRAVLIIRRTSRLFRESRKRSAMVLVKRHVVKTSWPGLVAVLRTETKRLKFEYSRVSGNAFSDLNNGRGVKNGSRTRQRRIKRRDDFTQDDDVHDEDLLLEGDFVEMDSDDKGNVWLEYVGSDFEAPRRNNLNRRQHIPAAKSRQHESHFKTRDRSGKSIELRQEYPDDYEEEAVGSVRHGPRRDKALPKEDQDSIDYGGLESQDFPADVVRSRPDDMKDEERKQGENDSIQESSDDVMDPEDSEFVPDDSVTLSDRLEQAKLNKGEACVEELHNASRALGNLGPDDPLHITDDDGSIIAQRSRRGQGRKRSPREVSPIPDSEGASMRRRKPNTVHLLKTPEKRQRTEPANSKGQMLKRGRFEPHEDEWLVEGIKKYGWGAWQQIVTEYYGSTEYARTAISLKDRARTLALDSDKYPRQSTRGRPPKSARADRISEVDTDEDIDEDESQGDHKKDMPSLRMSRRLS